MLIDISTPYNIVESIYWLVKYFRGPSKKFAGIVTALPYSSILNAAIKPEFILVFVGDIMPLGRRVLRFSADLKEFTRGSDYLIANFEGTITEQPKKALFSPSDQQHSKEIIGQLENLFSPKRTYLCVANNHAGDFGRKEFCASVSMLKSHHFHVFGWNEQPFADINEALRVVGGTMWLNRRCDYLSMLETASDNIKPSAFNILYPHFGYEHELYPRPEIAAMSKQFIKKFDAVIGHHPHCPQAVTSESVQGNNRLLAYSLGNFSGAFKTRKYQSGIALKMSVGQNDEGRWLAAHAEWRFTHCMTSSNGDCTVT